MIATQTLTMPAEWSRHERCLMSFPARDYWTLVADFEAARREWAGVANAIARFEPVLMVTAPGSGKTAKAYLEPSIEILELPVDDAWMRDNGPIFITNANKREAVHFGFNAWGEKFPPWDKDEKLAGLLLEHLNIAKRVSKMILEGGSIVVDGEGTLITTEQCLLHPNRNPGMQKSEIETELKRQLGVEKIIWLPYGCNSRVERQL